MRPKSRFTILKPTLDFMEQTSSGAFDHSETVSISIFSATARFLMGASNSARRSFWFTATSRKGRSGKQSRHGSSVADFCFTRMVWVRFRVLKVISRNMNYCLDQRQKQEKA